MRSCVSLTLALALFASVSAAQAHDTVAVTAPPPKEKPAPNSLFFEVGGPGIITSVNYERRPVDAIGFRVGIGYSTQDMSFLNDASKSLSSDQWRITAPVMLDILGIRKREHTVEIGVGVALRYEYIKEVTSVTGNRDRSEQSILDAYGVGLLGYRYHPFTADLHFRMGMAVVIGNRLNYLGRNEQTLGPLPLPYIGIGASW